MSEPPEKRDLTLHDEELELDTRVRDTGSVRARKRIATEEVSELVPRGVEQVRIDHEPADEGDSGEIETLPDGSISIPLLEEELVISKRIVVRERIVIRKVIEIENTRVRAELRHEQIDMETTEEGSSNEGSSS
jgi:uncharacterized protein (TIGR02271 family)